jgi:hypothetical protein
MHQRHFQSNHRNKMKIFLMSLFALVGFSLFFLACTSPSAQTANDPVANDPVANEPVPSHPTQEHPTFNKEMAIGIGEDSAAAYALIASGEERKETVILLHGIPVN